ncbi:uncharacterized protein DUF1080 [Prosthecobacter fusiformis]|uniref:Uncharacterized protein DUF1080 n=1 Tax=Prosthecobacter fusiformis TaxID=48464 RepID=A0A4V3FE13_9BACT|nr:DUF1080 domain-containing protein [Prosthecobacter fusiformis]TDU64100.1 uncharacterized protein DUF1080 [Prosthecobacter fusiformis]
MKAPLFVLLLALGAAPLIAADAVSLFDGKTLAGWTGPDGAKPGAGWVVENGELHLNGTGGGNLLSEKEYTNFDLTWEWKVEEAGNNGIKYWVTKVNNKEWLGIEYQMIDDKKHPDGMKGGSHTTGSIYDIKAPVADKPLNAPGQWNSSRVLVQDGKIQHYLNGKLVCEADTKTDEWKAMIAKSKFAKKEGFAPGKGRIMLTDHHDKVWMRNLQIVEK